MHVLYLLDSIQASGAETSLLAMVPHLVSDGVRVEIAHFDGRAGLRAEFEGAGATVFACPAESRRARVSAARTVIADRRPDVVHTTLFEADVAGRVGAWREGVPVTTSLVNLAYGAPQRRASAHAAWKTYSAQAVDVATVRLCHGLHAISSTVADTMAKRLFVDRGRITVIPRGRGAAQLGTRSLERRAVVRSSLGLGDDQCLLLAVGRHAPQKGLDVAIRAMSAILVDQPRAVLVIAGREGTATPDLRDQIEAMARPDCVRLLGPRGDVPDLLVAADLLVFPSRWEGLGGTLIEALALETPIVASDLPELREALGGPEPPCAALAKVDDPASLARAILTTLDHADLARERTRRGLHLFEQRYEIGRVAAAMRSFHEVAAS